MARKKKFLLSLISDVSLQKRLISFLEMARPEISKKIHLKKLRTSLLPKRLFWLNPMLYGAFLSSILWRGKKSREEIAILAHSIAKDLPNFCYKHKTSLARNLRRAIIYNDYGGIKKDLTIEVIQEFLYSVCKDRMERLDEKLAEQGELTSLQMMKEGFSTESLKSLAKQNEDSFIAPARALPLLYSEILNTMEQIELEEQGNPFDPESFPKDGHAFEHWVSDGLEKFGWKARVTTGSGDQGIDIVAEKNEKKLAIQCKYLTDKFVGNKAVQEAMAGGAFYQADFQAVITNNGYTKSAKELAREVNVYLFTKEQIPEIENIIFQARLARDKDLG